MHMTAGKDMDANKTTASSSINDKKQVVSKERARANCNRSYLCTDWYSLSRPCCCHSRLFHRRQTSPECIALNFCRRNGIRRRPRDTISLSTSFNSNNDQKAITKLFLQGPRYDLTKLHPGTNDLRCQKATENGDHLSNQNNPLKQN